MTTNTIFYAKGDDPLLISAYTKAQENFKYFWREVAWEYRRIIPLLDTACVKVAFTQTLEGNDEPIVEHMWIGNIDFDGSTIYGELLNEPQQLNNIQVGDEVGVTLDQISDWMFVSNGKTYGGFTIQAMRSVMTEEELKAHDSAWGDLDFGDFNNILVTIDQITNPEYLVEHPMSIEMGESLVDFINENGGEVEYAGEDGVTFLHREVIAGNKTAVEILIANGANINAKTATGKTALDFATDLNWEHILPILS